MKKIFLFAISIILCSLSVYSNNDFVAREYFGEQASMIVPGAEHIWVKQDNIIPTYIKFRPERGFAEEVFFMHISKIFHLLQFNY